MSRGSMNGEAAGRPDASGPKAAILTFHNTPNFGATLQCYALNRRLGALGADVEVINYAPLRASRQYAKFLFLGRRRSLANIGKVRRFYDFVRDTLSMSGGPVFRGAALKSLADRYDIAFVGSDEVWKVDHMRPFDPAFYFDFLDPARTRLCAYAASASTVTNLRDYADRLRPLLARFGGLGVRDTWTADAVAEITGHAVPEVLDPTLVWDFGDEDLPPLLSEPYVAVYSWLGPAGMEAVRTFARREGLKVVSIGYRNKLADESHVAIGPREWMRLMKHSSAVVTDFFHGILFALIFRRPFFAYVNPAKRMKLAHALGWVGLSDALHDAPQQVAECALADLTPDWTRVEANLAPRREASIAYLREQLALATPAG